jgi:SOS-response transcriptional repressor LexA
MLATIKRFDQLIAYLRDEMGWPIARDSFEDVDDLFYDFTAEELGIDAKNAAKIQSIKRLRPLSPKQPWGIFFVKFEPKRLPVVALRRILGQVALKKRASANSAERAAWAADDLLFVSNYGEGDERQISFAHFARAQDGHDLPTLKVLGWDNRDTALHLDAVARELTEHLAWPDDDSNAEAWRKRWRAAFTLRHREVITTSKELSIRLAELARNIRDRIRTALAIETDKGPLTRLMKAFQTALVHDLDADGFADMYAQTIAYGLLSARITDPHRKTADDFAAHLRTNPFLRELMETFLKVGGRRGRAGGPGIDFDELGVSEVVELLDDANMEAVVRDFGDRNPQEDPVIHFYEHFLAAYDKKQKVSRGVFYTPRPVVSYIVRSVDELLRTEFGLADGLADTTTWGEMAQRHKDLKIPEGVSPEQDFVQILDPATGTGTFLVEVIDLIHKTLVAKWKAQGHGEHKIDALWNEYVPKHLLTRLHGYELLMAPYAIAHLKIGLKLYETGYRFGSDERARVYLTNALEPAQDFSGRFEFAIPALADEAVVVNKIKQQRFTVVVGNPPYSNYGQLNKTTFLLQLLEDYKKGLGERKVNLDDDFIKFVRFSQWVIDTTGFGLVGLITNNTYLDGVAHRLMRRSLLTTFQKIWINDLHGSAKRNETSIKGAVDENVFDIQQGVAISCFAKTTALTSKVLFSDFWGTRSNKYERLQHTTVNTNELIPLTAQPYGYYFVPQRSEGAAEYGRYWSIAEIFPVYSSGIDTKIDRLLIDSDATALAKRIADILNPENSIDYVRRKYKIPSTSTWEIKRAKSARFRPRCITPITYRVFDSHYTYFDERVLSRARREVMQHMLVGKNLGLICARQLSQRGQTWSLVGVSNKIVERCAISSNTREGNYLFPLWLFRFGEELIKSYEVRPNLASRFLRALGDSVGVEQNREEHLPEGLTAEDVFHYAYSVLHSPGYRSRYAEFLKIDFPRLPVPGSVELLRALARLGGELVALHLLESPKLAKPITEFIGSRNPDVEKVSWSRNTVWIDKDQTVGFKGVREDVWNFHIGGYQVCEKWLKDRKGRRLSKNDIAHYHKIVVALSETIRLMKEIDEVIVQHGGWPGAFHLPAEASAQAGTGEAEAATATVIAFRPRTVEPKPAERYKTCVPFVPLQAAAGAFGDPQHVEDDGFEWVAVESRHRLRPGMFVAQVVGKSMEPAIPDGAYCLFRAPVEGTRQGKTVLVQLRDATDPETGQRYTVKRYESEKVATGDAWRHERITLKPLNPDFAPIVLTGSDAGELQVIAELVEVLGSES